MKRNKLDLVNVILRFAGIIVSVVLFIVMLTYQDYGAEDNTLGTGLGFAFLLVFTIIALVAYAIKTLAMGITFAVLHKKNMRGHIASIVQVVLDVVNGYLVYLLVAIAFDMQYIPAYFFMVVYIAEIVFDVINLVLQFKKTPTEQPTQEA